MNRTSSDFLYLMAIGDAFGMKYEFVDHDIPVGITGLFYGSHPTFKEYQIGRYTDDTQMSLANTELILRKRPTEIGSDDFVTAWIEVFERDPRLGYSKYMFQLMSDHLSSKEFCARLNPSKRVTGGSIMRSAPFGLFADVNVVKRLTTTQAMITHNTTTGITSSLFAALSSHYLHHGGKLAYLDSFLDSHLGKNWCTKQNGLTDDPSNGLRIASQVLNTLKSGDRLSDTLLAGASQSKIADTDTICAVAMAISSRRYNVQNDIPTPLKEGLENGPFGRDYLKRIDQCVAQQFPRSQFYATFVPS